MELPQNLSRDLILLLRQDLQQVEGLTKEQWPALIYYASLFIFGLAKTAPSVLDFTYSSIKETIFLKQIAQNHEKNIDISLSEGVQVGLVVDTSLKDHLQKELNLYFPKGC